MSSGADCHFREKNPNEWYYAIQQYPYGAVEDYDTYGPFRTFAMARKHLDNNHQNPGGWSVSPYFWLNDRVAVPNDEAEGMLDGMREGTITAMDDDYAYYTVTFDDGTVSPVAWVADDGMEKVTTA